MRRRPAPCGTADGRACWATCTARDMRPRPRPTSSPIRATTAATPGSRSWTLPPCRAVRSRWCWRAARSGSRRRSTHSSVSRARGSSTRRCSRATIVPTAIGWASASASPAAVRSTRDLAPVRAGHRHAPGHLRAAPRGAAAHAAGARSIAGSGSRTRRSAWNSTAVRGFDAGSTRHTLVYGLEARDEPHRGAARRAADRPRHRRHDVGDPRRVVPAARLPHHRRRSRRGVRAGRDRARPTRAGR